jgi:hypothetical protein
MLFALLRLLFPFADLPLGIDRPFGNWSGDAPSSSGDMRAFEGGSPQPPPKP